MPSDCWKPGNGKVLRLDRPVLIAILNVTPDSFSDGGQLPDAAAAARAAETALRDGAAALDIGGESTRPGAPRIPADEQVLRVIPALREVRRAIGDAIPISVDTTLAAVAEAALDAGADAINDVSAGLENPGVLDLAAQRGAGLILMHRLAPPGADTYSDRYQAAPSYDAAGGVVEAVRGFLCERLEAAVAAGVDPNGLVLDPGLGFGKSVEQNLELIAATPRLAGLGRPILSALSRKSFTARAAGLGPETPPASRLHATLGLSIAHLRQGARLFRVHDVAPHAEALTAAWAVMGRHLPNGDLSHP